MATGQTFIVTRNDEPVAELRPIRPGRRMFVGRDEVAALGTAGVRIGLLVVADDLLHDALEGGRR